MKPVAARTSYVADPWMLWIKLREAWGTAHPSATSSNACVPVLQGCSVFDYDALPQKFGVPVAVPNTNSPLPIQCPKCQHNGSRLVVRSLTVMSLTCANCGHFWATDLESLPLEIQEKIPDALRDL
jgi:hypothetical protein